jgi:hypothetical protein
VGWDSKPETEESIVVICYGKDIAIIKQLIEDSVEFNMEEDKG